MALAITILLWNYGDEKKPKVSRSETYLYEYIDQQGERRPTCTASIDFLEDGTATIAISDCEVDGVSAKGSGKINPKDGTGEIEIRTLYKSDFMSSWRISGFEKTERGYRFTSQKIEGHASQETVTVLLTRK
jgi:hypothetical protein